MFFAKSDFVEAGTFGAQLKSAGDGRVLVKVYASSGCVKGTPYFVSYGYTTNTSGLWMQATAITASQQGILGVASDAVASGCFGWVTIRGKVADAQGAATSFTGSCGHGVYWAGATGLGASGSAYVGLNYQIGVLMEDTNASTTADIFLAGRIAALSI